MRWTELPFKDFVTLQRGFDLPKARMAGGEVPVLGSNCVLGYHNETKVQAPGVVTGRSGTLGVVQYAEHPFWPHNTALWVKDFKGNDPKFVYYKLQTLHLERFNGGASVPTLNRNVLDTLPIRVPQQAEQARIAAILSAYDALIGNNHRRIQLLERAARLLYKEWFVHLRFPGHEHVKIRDGVPEGWERKTIGDITKTNQQSYRARELPEEINYIDISSVARGRIAGKSTMLSSKAPGRARRKAKSGDVIWSNVRPNLRAFALVLNPKGNDVFSTGFTVLSPNAVPFSYLYLLITTDEFVGHLVNQATGVSYPAVRPEDFERASALLPPRRILRLFHQLTEPMFRLISTLEQEVEPLAQARDLLLPRLMNGEMSV